MKQEYTHVSTGYQDIIFYNGRAYVYIPQPTSNTKMTTPNTKINDEVPF